MAQRMDAVPPSEHRLPALDGLRGVAILLVMVHHLFVLKPQTALETCLENVGKLGMFGVDLFFVLSGFLITGILLQTREAPQYFRNFYARRVLRIMPLYYLLVAVCFLAPLALLILPQTGTQAARLTGFLGDWPWYVGFASNLLFTHKAAYQHPVLDVTWSLAIEEQFYLLWPLLVWLVPRRPLRWVCCFVIGAAFLTRWLAWSQGWNWISIYVFPLCRMDGLALGALVATCFRAEAPVPIAVVRRARVSWLLGVVGLLVMFAAGLTMDARGPASLGYYVLAGVVATTSLLLVLTAPPNGFVGRLLTGRWLTFFGKYSYAIYLFHCPIRALIRDTLFGDAVIRSLPMSPLLGQLIFYLVAGAAVIPFALLSWRFLEQPCLRLKKWFAYAPSRAGDDRIVPTTIMLRVALEPTELPRRGTPDVVAGSTDHVETAS
jgi:peptidoglycan/LPS O-acetylase OafA/YrhL